MARKSNRPEPAPCPRCKRLPVVVKTRPGLWRVACPFLDCAPLENAWGGTEQIAVRNWNEEATKCRN
jgi:hypothetical protein